MSFRLEMPCRAACRRPGSGRRRRPVFEPLEDRALAALGFTSAFGLAASFPTADHVAIDAADNTYVTGSFVGTANFDPGFGSAGVLKASQGSGDGFVAKYSSAHTLDWVRQFATVSSGTGDSSQGTGIAVDANTGSVYVVGQFLGTVNFNPGGAPLLLTSGASPITDPSTGITTNPGDSFLLKLTPGGAIASGVVKQYGGAMGHSEFNAVTLSADGKSVYVTGMFTGTLDFDPGGTRTTLTSPMHGDAFALKLDDTLGFGFVKEANLDSSEGFGVAADAAGFVAIAGTVASTEDSFVARFDTFGNLNAERAFLGTHPTTMADAIVSLVTDGIGFYAAGTFRGNEVNFNATTGTPAVTLDSRGGSDSVLIKLDSRLNIVWARRFGSPGGDKGTGVAVDGSNHVYLTGSVSGLATFGTTGLGGWPSSAPAMASQACPTASSSRSTAAATSSSRLGRAARAPPTPPASRPTARARW
jgi:hypothetical protein